MLKRQLFASPWSRFLCFLQGELWQCLGSGKVVLSSGWCVCNLSLLKILPPLLLRRGMWCQNSSVVVIGEKLGLWRGGRLEEELGAAALGILGKGR